MRDTPFATPPWLALSSNANKAEAKPMACHQRAVKAVAQ